MSTQEPRAPAEFDEYAGSYEAALEQGIKLSGEDSEYFARERVAWTAHRIDQLGAPRASVLDFGCGAGSATPYLAAAPETRRVVGADVSAGLLDVARERHGSAAITFCTTADVAARAPFDVAHCNGVFHHIPPCERAEAVAVVHEALAPGGLFAFWENNPWNPGTRMVMKRIPFDRDAVTLAPPEARRLLSDAGFEIVRTDSRFLFPAVLRRLRPLERLVVRAPIGAQYLVLAQKPMSR